MPYISSPTSLKNSYVEVSFFIFANLCHQWYKNAALKNITLWICICLVQRITSELVTYEAWRFFFFFFNALSVFILLCGNIHSPGAVWWWWNGEYIFLKAIYNSMLNSLITVEILYSLRLGSELDCKYGPDLEIKHFFQVKKEN